MPPAITSTIMPKNVIRLMYSHHHASGFRASNRDGIQYITANISPDRPGRREAAGPGVARQAHPARLEVWRSLFSS
jgi:hypothetical protein